MSVLLVLIAVRLMLPVPWLQAQVKLPGVLVQAALGEQLSAPVAIFEGELSCHYYCVWGDGHIITCEHSVSLVTDTDEHSA